MLSENKTKDKILNASLKLLNEVGYGGLGISEVARVAKISKQNLYYHYPSMETIFYDLVMQWSHTGQQCTIEALAQNTEGGALRVLGMVRGMFLWMERHAELTRLGLVMFQSGHKIKKVKQFMDQARSIGRERIKGLLLSDPTFKKLKPALLEELTQNIHTSMYGSFLYVVAMNDFEDLKKHEDACAKAIRHLLHAYRESL